MYKLLVIAFVIKNILFSNNKYIVDENQLLEAAQKKNYYEPVLKTIGKRNVCENENVYFQRFWTQVFNIC